MQCRMKEEQDRQHKLAALAAAKAVKTALNSSVPGNVEAEFLQPSAPPLFPTLATEFDPLTPATPDK